MGKCAVCDTELQPEQKTCHVCGSNVEAAPEAATKVPPPPPPKSPTPPPTEDVAEPLSTQGGERECPACGKIYNATYSDEFCSCGTELIARISSAGSPVETPVPVPATPVPTPAEKPAPPSGSTRPPVGTACLVVYSDTKPRQPIQYFPIERDVSLIGREDAVRGDFPDLDLSSFLDESLSKKVSRRHAEVLRARDSQLLALRPLPGNTGTQVGKELTTAGQTYPLVDGTPIILGGTVWMKFEIIK